jgi:hypothetical protein
MNKTYIILIILFLVFFNCSMTLQMLPQPQADKNLIIGSVILEINGYQGNYQVIWQNIEVAIVGRYVDNGRLKKFDQWVTVDDNGCFYSANVPDGEYIIKALKVYQMGIGDIIIANELNDPDRNYFELQSDAHIILTAEFFDTKPYQHIISFKHNIFTLYPNNIVNLRRLDHLKEVKLIDGNIITSPAVQVYFNEQYPDNPWQTFLNMQVSK